MRHRTKKIIAVVTLACIAAAGVWYFFVRSESLVARNNSNTGAETPVSSTTAERTPPPGQKLYHSSLFKFSIFYPEQLSQSERHNGSGTTLVFQSTTTPVAGFQMYIFSYGEPTISEQRFKMDEPSGVRKNVQEGLLDGVKAASFESTDLQLGDTYEVWFINKGYLYEVTTLKVLEPWLQQIMLTWQFDS